MDDCTQQYTPHSSCGLTLSERSRGRSRSPDRINSISISPAAGLDLPLREVQAIFCKCGRVQAVFVDGDAAIVTFSEAHYAREAVRRFHSGKLNGRTIDVFLVSAMVQEQVYTHVRVSSLSGETVHGPERYLRPLKASSLRREVAKVVGKEPRECRLAHQSEKLESGDIVPWGLASQPVEVTLILVDLPKDRRKVFVTELPDDIEEDELLQVFGTYGAVVDVQLTQPGSATIQYENLMDAADAVAVLHGVYSIRHGALAPIQVTRSPLPSARPLEAEELPIDDRFVLVRDLSADVLEEEISQVFSTYGRVFYVELGCATPKRALVGYDRADMARKAAQCLHEVYRFREAANTPITVTQYAGVSDS